MNDIDNGGPMIEPIPDENIVKGITVAEAANILGRSTQAVRQLLHRGRIASFKDGRGRVTVDLGETLTYYARKLRIKAFETHRAELFERGVSFITYRALAQKLNVKPRYVMDLVKKNKLRGYMTSDGDLLVETSSADQYLSVPDGADDL